MIEDGLRALLLTQESITNLLGVNTDGTKPVRCVKLREKDSFPAIVINIPESRHINDIEADGGAVDSTVQFMCMATTLSAARALSNELRTVLAGYTGPAGLHDIDAIYVDETTSGFVPLDDASENGIFSVDLNCLIQHGETVPNN